MIIKKDKIQCPKCGFENADTVNFCAKCGNERGSKNLDNAKFCGKCGFQAQGNIKFCVKCGNKFPEINVKEEKIEEEGIVAGIKEMLEEPYSPKTRFSWKKAQAPQGFVGAVCPYCKTPRRIVNRFNFILWFLPGFIFLSLGFFFLISDVVGALFLIPLMTITAVVGIPFSFLYWLFTRGKQKCGACGVNIN